MDGSSAFAACHPLVNLIFFVLAPGFSLFFPHPLFLAASLTGALVCAVQTNGGAAVRRSVRWLVPAALLAAAVNLAFNHEGATILLYLPSGNPLTLESAAYGLAAAVLIAAAMLWFSCWNAVMTPDKLMYLFGRAAPSLSLMLSMTLRFVPRFQARFRETAQARRGMGLGTEGRRLRRLREGAAVFSAVVTWSLESAAETADSMKSRGYGLPGRTAFSLFRFDRRDRRLLVLLSVCGAYVFFGWAAGGVSWRYYPTLRGALTPFSVSVSLVYLALCLTPAFLNWREERLWSCTVSRD